MSPKETRLIYSKKEVDKPKVVCYNIVVINFGVWLSLQWIASARL